MLDKLKALAQGTPGGEAKLLQFYQEFLPQIPPMRGTRPSDYCMSMLARGIDRFQAAGQLPQAQALSAQLAKLKSGTGR